MKLSSAFFLFFAATPTLQACAPLSTQASFPAIAELPNPFQNQDGTLVTSKDDWACRQSEISSLFQSYELGTKPPAPSNVTASFSSSTLTITASDSGKSISFSVTITYPSSGTAPYPALIAYAGGSLPQSAGVAIVNFNNDDIAAATAGAMSAWAWGVSRVIDALELVPASSHKIDVSSLGITGCSRNGKGALVAGAFDDRIVLTIPQESGSGGSACWRLSDYSLAHPELADNQAVQTASEIVQENVWFSQEGLFVIENTDYEWLGPWSSFGCITAAREIYNALSMTDNFGFSQIGGHSHCAFPSSQQSDLDAYVGKFLLNKTGSAVWRSDLPSNEPFNKGDWVNWTTPVLT